MSSDSNAHTEGLFDASFPLSAAQLNIYLAQKLAPDVPFTIAQYVEFRGGVDIEAMIAATDTASRELGSPGLRVLEVGGAPMQLVDYSVPYTLTHRDFRSESDPVASAQAYMHEHFRRRVDMVEDQLVVAELLQLGERHFYWYSRAHHVAMDGLGAISVQERTAALYTAMTTGSEAPTLKAVLPGAIYDYETAYLGSSRAAADREYWMDRLADQPPPPRLGGRVDAASAAPIVVGDMLDDALAAHIAAIGSKYNTSDVPMVIAAFALYLARMTGTEDVTISLPVSGRTTALLRKSSGMMSNIVPLRLNVDSAITVHALLQHIQVELTGALRHQRYRVEDMQRDLGMGGSGGAAGRGAFGPTLNIMMYDNEIRLGETTGEYRILSSGPIDDLMVNLYPGVAGSNTRVDFLGNPGVYSETELRTHHRNFLTLLAALAQSSDTDVLADLQVSTDAHRSAMLAPTPRVIEPRPLDRVFADGQDSSGLALVYGTSELTYPELEQITDSLAAHIGSLAGAGRLMIALERSGEQVLAVRASAKAGVPFVPVDPADPPARLATIASDASVTVGITDRAHVAELPTDVEWTAVEDLLDRPRDAVPHRPPHVDAEAYVIYTSGSTGTPKGVSVTHRGFAQLASAVVDRYQVIADSRVLALASPVFDASIQELVMAFAAGATLVVAPASVSAGPALAQLIREQKITHLVCSPAVLATLTPGDLDDVRVFDVGGDAVSAAVVDDFAPNRTMLNAYGPTEATVLATLSQPLQADTSIDMGLPLPGVRALVLDAALQPVPYGGVGELYLGGDGIARGYLGAPGASAARFVADPGESGRRLYRTGDVVRWNIDGTALEYLRRSDSQVQLRGRRVEPAEVERALLAVDGVESAAVAVRGDRLIGFVTGEVDTATLAPALQDSLASYLIPSAFVLLDELPLTAGGKLDRRALPDATAEAPSVITAPSSDAQRAVAAAFTEVLGVTEVGLEHDFFALGGNSLNATRVLARLHAQGYSGVDLPTLFAAPSVQRLAAQLGESSSDTEVSIAETIVPQRIPLSYSQQRMWFLNQLDTRSPAYNMPVVLALPPDIDLGAVVAAVHDVVERHAALRTYFPDRGDGPEQVIVDVDTALADQPVTTLPSESIEAAVRELATDGFDVAQQVPLRAKVLRREDGSGAVLVLVAHHIDLDGWSIDIVIRDMVTAYAARAASSAPSWVAPTVEYAQYAVWSRARVDAESARLLQFWTRTLTTDGPIAALHADFARPATQSLRTGSVELSLPASVRTAAASAQATPFMTIHAALAVVLSRLGNSREVVIGTPSAGRGAAELDAVVGMFVHTVPLAVTVNPAATFADLLAGVKQADLDAFAHAELPFERIVAALEPSRSLDRHPLFQVLLAYDNAPHASLDDLPVQPMPIATGTSEFDLNLVLADTEDGVAGHIEYAVDLYDERTVARFAAMLTAVLETVGADPSVVVGDIELGDIELGDIELGDIELGDIELGDIQLGDVDIAAPVTADSAETMLDLLTPHPGVAVDGEDALSFAHLDAVSNQWARTLIAHGAAPETTVAISLPRSAQYITAMWAVLKTGAAFVPVDPTYPATRRAMMLRGTVLGIGTGDEDHVTWVQANIDDSDAPVTDAERRGVVHPDSLAYIVHTSGSTGEPKPVAVSHRSVVALARAVVPQYAVAPHSRVLHGYSTNFDAAVLEIVLAFAPGATMVIAPDGLVGGDEMAQFIRRFGVTHFLSTPAVLSTIAPVESVTTIAVGGDVLPAGVVDRWAPGRRMLNAYGPTETTVVATLASELTPGGEVTIGTALSDAEAVVLDSRLHPVPDGGIGELYIGGLGLARGYARDPRSTATRFVAAPGGARRYRTGDAVRRRRDGALDYRGRLDAQVQLRGQRLEPGDVEAALRTHPEVRDACALVSDRTLTAWVVADTEADLRAWLLDRLPLWMVPAAIERIDAIPLTDNGKTDRRALLASIDDTPGGSSAVRSAAEDIVATVFADVLGIESVPTQQSFFVLGGDSLSATRAASRIGSALGVDVPVRMLFEAPTVRTLAAAAAGATRGRSDRPALTHRPSGALRATTATSAAERRMWLQNRMDPRSSAYNLAFEVAVPADLDLAILRSAVLDVVDRHLPLRTVYPAGPSGPVARRIAASDVIGDIETSAETPQNLAAVGFDLTVEPPVRIHLCNNGETLVVVAHHIAVDGLSLEPLARDLVLAHEARSRGRAPLFSATDVDYADYRHWHNELLAQVSATQLEYWRGALAGLPEFLELPTGTPVPGEDTTEIPFALDDCVRSAVKDLASRRGATVFMVLHAALAVLLAELSGTEDIAIGTPVAGRDDAALDELVGMFAGTVVLRTPVPAHATFEEFVVDVRDRDLDAFAHADVPFETVVDALDPQRSTDNHPFFQVMLAFAGLQAPTVALGDVPVTPVQLFSTATQFDLEVVLNETEAGIGGSLGFAASRFSRSAAHTFVQRYLRAVTAVTSNPAVPLGEIDLLGDDRTSGVSAAGVSVRASIGEVFARAVADHPDATALIDGDTSITYRVLDARAESLQRALTAHGAGPGTVVAIAAARSVEFFVAVWAVARSGAGYLPVDPSHPTGRIADMLREVEPVVGITDPEHVGALPDSITWVAADSSAPEAQPVQTVTAALDDTVPALDDTAYVIYTSGSTGTPKGVRVTHRGVADLVASQRVFGVRESSRVLAFASPGFDASVFEMLLAVGGGAALVLVPTDVYGGRELTDLLTEQAVTHLCLTPTVLQATDPSTLDALEVVVMAGEPANSELVRRWATDRAVFNAYGPTEATIMATCTTAIDGSGVTTIGTPTLGFDAVVLDSRLRHVAAEVVGELYLSAPALAQGYVANAAATSDRFVADPFGVPGARMYRTGDLVRWVDVDGVAQLEYLGRVDSQVKIRGHRIERGEVESALLRYPAVTSAHVEIVQSRSGAAELVAYVAGPRDLAGMREFLGRELPRYMVPAAITHVEAMPLTSSGKIDAARLPTPSYPAALYVAPVTDLERTIVDAFSRVLDLDADRIGMSDNFFDLGGHSLAAVRVMDELSIELGRRLPVVWLLTEPSVAHLAARLASADADTRTPFDVLLPIRPEGTLPPLFCIHPAVGVAWSYLGLAGHVSADRPVYGLQVPGLLDPSERSRAPSSIEEYAQRYIDEIRTVAPTGPYLLLGWSLGGVIAHAIATALQEAGDTVELLAMMDSRLYVPEDAPQFSVADLAEQLGVTGTSFESIAVQLRRTRPELDFVTAAHLERMFDPVLEAPRLVRQYRPVPYRGDLLLFTAVGSDADAQWADHVEGTVHRRGLDRTHEDLASTAALEVVGRDLEHEMSHSWAKVR